MPLINSLFDSLPYIDSIQDGDPAMLDAKATIDAEAKEAAADSSHALHPALLPVAAAYTPIFSDAVEREHARLDGDPASKFSAIDLTRYEALDLPPGDGASTTSDQDRSELVQRWNTALKQAFTTSEYVQARLTQLGLLERFGKNAWLVGNGQLEDILRGIESELAQVRKQQEEVDMLRRLQQESQAGEIAVLEETWRKGVGRVLETEVAAEGLRQQILDKRRAGAV